MDAMLDPTLISRRSPLDRGTPGKLHLPAQGRRVWFNSGISRGDTYLWRRISA